MTDYHQEALFHAWGPYGKGYMGYSHLPHLARHPREHPVPLTMRAAARLDCVVAPMLHSVPAGLPNTTAPSGCHPWETSERLDHVQYRWELGLGPSHQAYADTSFTRLDDQRVLIHTRYVNNTDRTLDAVLNYFISLSYPYDRVCRLKAAPGLHYLAGEDRLAVSFAQPRPWDCQQPDAHPKAVFRDPAFTDGFGFGDRLSFGHVPHLDLQPWGVRAGDKVTFRLPDTARPGLCLAIRYRTVPRLQADALGEFAAEALGSGHSTAPALGAVGLVLSGAAQADVALPPSDTLRLELLEDLRWLPGDTLRLTAMDNPSGLEIDCLLLGTKDAILASTFVWEQLHPGQITLQADQSGYTLRFPSIGESYLLTPLNATTRQRWVHSGTLEDAEPMRLSNPHFTFDDLQRPFSATFARKHSTPGLWFNAIQPGILVAPGTQVDCWALLSWLPEGSSHSADAVEAHPLAHVRGLSTGQKSPGQMRALTASAAQQDAPFLPLAPENIRSGMAMLRATLLQNLVYPIYTKQGWICHFTPGKRWDNLYTWDGGFIAMGLLHASRSLAEYMLDLYLAPLDDPEQAFVHHGSPVPVQWMALRELVAGQSDQEQARLLGRYYARARLMYAFLRGRSHSATTDPFQTGLLTTYDYFYSVSGMDDYPPQLLAHMQGIAHRLAPVITTAQVMLGARTLGLLASRYGELTVDRALKAQLEEDQAGYQSDLERLSHALETYAWDQASGYYAYVLHDEHGDKLDILRHEDGDNLNRGFDGIYPLLAYGGNAPHRARLLDHIKSPQALLTPYGLSAVDQSASYFSLEGYWNGGLWFPHAWYFGRAMLDYGEGHFLLELVKRQLQAWCKQANSRWHSFEMLRVASGEGAWHFSFGGLAAPLLNWAHSLYTPGTITCGHAALLIEKDMAADSLRLRLRQADDATSLQLWACLGEKPAQPFKAIQLTDSPPGFRDTLIVSGDGREEDQGTLLPCHSEEILTGLFQLSIRNA